MRLVIGPRRLIKALTQLNSDTKKHYGFGFINSEYALRRYSNDIEDKSLNSS